MIYVMSDIHGMYDKYIEMMDLIDLKENDSLYILGDIVDRANGSMKILKDMMKRPNVFGIFGNHELMMADCFNIITQEITNELLDNFDEEALMKLSDWMNNGAFQTIQEFKKLSKEEQKDIIEYLMEFTAYEEVEVKGRYYLLVHAGLGDFSEEKSLDEYDVNDFVWKRPDWDIPYFTDPNKFVVVGHTPTLGINGKPEIFYKNNFIAIDCGACFENGMLACLCLDTMEEFYV